MLLAAVLCTMCRLFFSGRRGRHRTAQRDDDNAVDNDGDGGLLMIPDLEDDGEDEFAIKSMWH
jgi:hypothetical protein